MKLKNLLLGVAFILLAGCQSQSNVQMTETAQVTKIIGAETLVVSLSQTPEVTETPPATVTPSATLAPTITSTQTQTNIFTLTPTLPPNSGGDENPSNCDRARFVEDVSIPDGTEMSPGQSFTKTWRLENTGTCPWTAEYSVQFLNGIEMAGNPTPMNSLVEPGETVDLSINFTAPSDPGVHVSEWALVNENGLTFEKSFFVQIVVPANDDATPSP